MTNMQKRLVSAVLAVAMAVSQMAPVMALAVEPGAGIVIDADSEQPSDEAQPAAPEQDLAPDQTQTSSDPVSSSETEAPDLTAGQDASLDDEDAADDTDHPAEEEVEADELPDTLLTGTPQDGEYEVLDVPSAISASTLQDLVDAAIADGGELTLSESYTENITVKGDLNLHLNDQTIQNAVGSKKSTISVESGTLTIDGTGYIIAADDYAYARAIHVKNNATVTINDAGVTVKNSTPGQRVLDLVDVDANATFNLKNGTLEADLGIIYPAVYAHGTFNMSGGKVTSKNHCIISSDSGNSNINITGGVVEMTANKSGSNTACAILARNHLTITNATVTVAQDLRQKGIAAIRSETQDHQFEDFEEHLETQSPHADINIGSGADITGDVSFTGYRERGKLNFTGGTINGNVSLGKNLEAKMDDITINGTLNLQTDAADGCHIQINGGTYTGALKVSDDSSVAIAGGLFTTANPSNDLASGSVCIEYEGQYYVGSDAEDVLRSAGWNEEITIVAGDLTISGIQEGVIIINEGDGTVIVNDIEIQYGQTVAIYDYTSLVTAMQMANDVLTGPRAEYVTEESKQQLRSDSRYTSAVEMLENHSAMDSSEIEQAAIQLQMAVTSIIKYKEADWTRFDEALAAAKALQGDSDIYDGFPAVDAAIERAEALEAQKESINASRQSEIDSDAEALEQAVSKLVEKDVLSIDPETGIVKLRSTHMAKDLVQGVSLTLSLTPKLKDCTVEFAADEAFLNDKYYINATFTEAENKFVIILSPQATAPEKFADADNTDITLGTISVTKDEQKVMADIVAEKAAIKYTVKKVGDESGYDTQNVAIKPVTVTLDGIEKEIPKPIDLEVKSSVGYDLPEDAPSDWLFQLLSGICAFPGSTLTYTFTVDNVYTYETRNNSSYNVVLKDTLPEEFELKAATKGYTWDPDTRTISWTVPEIAGSGANKQTFTVKVELKEPMLHAGWTNFATATCDNGKQESYKSVPVDPVADEMKETLLYSYYVFFDSNGGNDTEDGTNFFIIRLNDQGYDKDHDPNFKVEFPGEWYAGRSDGSWGGDPTPTADMGDNVIFAGWAKTKYEDVQTEKPEDMVATIEAGELSGETTIKNNLMLYAVWANDVNENDTPDFLDPADLTDLKRAMYTAERLDPDDYRDFDDVLSALASVRALVEREAELTLEDQAVIDSAKDTLENACDELVVVPRLKVTAGRSLTCNLGEFETGIEFLFEMLGIAMPNTDVEYTITVKNQSVNFAATNVQPTITIPDGMTVKDQSNPAYTYDSESNTVTWTAATVAKNSSKEFTVTATVDTVKAATAKISVSVTADNASESITGTGAGIEFGYILGYDPNGGIPAEENAGQGVNEDKSYGYFQLTNDSELDIEGTTVHFPLDGKDTTIYLPSPQPEWEHTAFAGWSRTKHAGTQESRPEDMLESVDVSGNMWIYAVWGIDENDNGIADFNEPPKDVELSAKAGRSVTNNLGEFDTGLSFVYDVIGVAMKGASVEYTVTVTNKDTEAKAMNLVTTVTLPAGMSSANTKDGGVYDAEANTMTWTTEALEKSASKTFTFTATVNKVMAATASLHVSASCDNCSKAVDGSAAGVTFGYILGYDPNGGITPEDNAGQGVNEDKSFGQFQLDNEDLDIDGTTIHFSLSDSTVLAPKPQADWERVTFGGWALEKLEGTQTERPEDLLETVDITENMWIYAVWAEDWNENQIPDWNEDIPVGPANLERIKDLVAKAQGIDKELYTDTIPLDTALRNANLLLAREDELTDRDQPAIDAAADALQKALDELKFKDWVTLGEDGTVTLHSNHIAKDQISTIRLSIDVAPALDNATVAFTFDKAVTAIIKTAMAKEGKVNLYIATGLGAVMDGTELVLGKLTVTTQDGKAVAADVNVAENALSYVLYNQETTGKMRPVSVHLDGVTAASLDALRSAVAAASDLDTEMYADTEAFTQALDAAQALLDRADALTSDDQTDIDDAESALRDAMAALQYKPADKTALEKAIQDAEDIVRDHYTDLTNLDDALAVAKAWKDSETADIRDQKTIDDVTQALRDVMASLTLKPADYSDVYAAKLESDTVDRTLYTQESLDKLDAAIAGVQEGLDVLHQADVDKMAKAIRDAAAALEYKDADLSALKDAVKTAGALDPEEYEDFSAVEKALAAANAILGNAENLDIRDQKTIDDAAAALLNAVAALTHDVADYSRVEEVKQAADGLDRRLYTEKTLAVLDAALSSVEYGLDVRDQARVDRMAEAIWAAIRNLAYKPAEYAGVETARQHAKDIDRSLYTEDSLKELGTALSTVQESLDIRYQDRVDGMAKAIEDAISKLVFKAADTSALETLLAETKGLNEKHFEDFTAVKDAMLNAQALLDRESLDIRDQAALDAAAQALKDAVSALKFKGADLTALLTEKAKAELLDADNYTDFSGVAKALQDANALLEEELDVQDQDRVDAAAKALEQALAALTLKAADYSDLDKTLKQAKDIDRNLYTEKSLKVLDDAVAAIDRDKTILEQEDVDAMERTVSDAIRGLTFKPADKTKLESAIQNAEKLDANAYKDFSKVKSALKAAKELAEDAELDIRGQADIDAAVKALNDAVKALEPKPAQQNPAGGNTGSSSGSNNNNGQNNNNQASNKDNGNESKTEQPANTQQPAAPAPVPASPLRGPSKTGIALAANLLAPFMGFGVFGTGLIVARRKKRDGDDDAGLDA